MAHSDDDHLSDVPSEDDHQAHHDSTHSASDVKLAEELEALRPRGIDTAINILHCEFEAEDVVDNVTGRLIIEKKDPKGAPLDAWFLRCVRNEALDVIKSPKWRKTSEAELERTGSNAEQFLRACNNEHRERLDRALSELSADERELIWMRHV